LCLTSSLDWELLAIFMRFTFGFCVFALGQLPIYLFTPRADSRKTL
jgi:hypothetical protein